MKEFTVTTSRRNEILDITNKVNALIPASLQEGIVFLFTPHTTTGLALNENYDPAVKHDFLAKLEKVFPKEESYYHHDEGNSDAHLKAVFTGSSLQLPLRKGKLALGTWQGIYFCEFDGPRTRKVQLFFQTTDPDLQ